MKTILNIFFISTLLILSTSCIKYVQHNPAVEATILKHINSGDTIIDFKDVIPFEWDSMIVLGHYTHIDRLGDSLDFNFKPVKHSGIEYLDHFCLMVLIHSEEIISMVEFGPSIEPELEFIDRNDSRFSIERVVSEFDIEKTWVILKKVNYP